MHCMKTHCEVYAMVPQQAAGGILPFLGLAVLILAAAGCQVRTKDEGEAARPVAAAKSAPTPIR